jgi:DNA helicase-4
VTITNQKISWTERRRWTWFYLRRPSHFTLTSKLFTFNEKSWRPALVSEASLDPAPFPLSLFNLKRIKFSVRNRIFHFIVPNDKGNKILKSALLSISSDIDFALQGFETRTAFIESAISAVFHAEAFVRHSEALALAADVSPQYESLIKNFSIFEECALANESQRPQIQKIRVRLDTAFSFIGPEQEKNRAEHNDAFVAFFKKEETEFFKNVESSELTDEQIDAALIFEDANLVVAAAGSGKSSCIVAKIGFALKNDLFQEDEILALAYNKAAAEGLQERLNEKLKNALGREVRVASRTFHSYGLSILKKHYGDEVEIRVFKEEKGEEGRLIKSTLDHLFNHSADFRDALSHWILMASYEDPQPTIGSDDLEQCAKRYEECCRERIRAKTIPGRKSFEPTIPTYASGLYVRSLQERGIVNWLLLHNVPFEYEKPDWEGGERLKIPPKASGKKPPYNPDFTYHITKTGKDGSRVKVRLVHEHFALNANGQAPAWIGGEKYARYAKQKREMYREWERESPLPNKERVRFFETWSSDFYDGTLFSKLESFLKAEGVLIGKPNHEVEERALESFREMSELENDLTKFVLTFKESGLSKTEVEECASESDNPFRSSIFLRVAFKLFDAYQAALKRDNLIDYADMLRDAHQILKLREKTEPYKLVLVDEFQDISKLRANLVKSLLDQRPTESIVFCVGDDWQTINRFAGSDVRIFTDLENYLQRRVRRVDLNKTFRCAQGIADVSRAIVMRNASQLDKEVVSYDPNVIDTIRVIEHENTASARREALVREIDRIKLEGPRLIRANKKNDKRLSLKILRRTRPESTCPEGIDEDYLQELQRRYARDIEIQSSSVHGSKGLEADFVIIPGLDSGFKGFPDVRESNQLMDLILPPIADGLEEERRLLYVGLTRARHQVILLTSAENPSEFVLELAEQKKTTETITWEPHETISRIPCPVCVIGSIQAVWNGKIRKCTRFSVCGYKE